MANPGKMNGANAAEKSGEKGQRRGTLCTVSADPSHQPPPSACCQLSAIIIVIILVVIIVVIIVVMFVIISTITIVTAL